MFIHFIHLRASSCIARCDDEEAGTLAGVNLRRRLSQLVFCRGLTSSILPRPCFSTTPRRTYVILHHILNTAYKHRFKASLPYFHYQPQLQFQASSLKIYLPTNLQLLPDFLPHTNNNASLRIIPPRALPTRNHHSSGPQALPLFAPTLCFSRSPHHTPHLYAPHHHYVSQAHLWRHVQPWIARS